MNNTFLLKANLAIIEDEPVILKSLSTFFENTENFVVVFTARQVEDLHKIDSEEVDRDLLLLDINLLGMSGFRSIPKILEMYPNANIVVLTTLDPNEYIFEEREKTFYINKNIALYGGFAGGEVALGERNLAKNEVLWNGDIGALVDTTDDAYHLVFIDGTSLNLPSFGCRRSQPDTLQSAYLPYG